MFFPTETNSEAMNDQKIEETNYVQSHITTKLNAQLKNHIFVCNTLVSIIKIVQLGMRKYEK